MPSGRFEAIEDWNKRRFCSHECYAAWHIGPNHAAFKPEGSKRKDGYVRVARAGKRVYLHREIAGAREGQEVHHLDENPSNNVPDNLVLTTPGEHKALFHAEHCRELAARQRGVPLTPEHRQAISKGMRAARERGNI